MLARFRPDQRKDQTEAAQCCQRGNEPKRRILDAGQLRERRRDIEEQRRVQEGRPFQTRRRVQSVPVPQPPHGREHATLHPVDLKRVMQTPVRAKDEQKDEQEREGYRETTQKALEPAVEAAQHAAIVNGREGSPEIRSVSARAWAGTVRLQ